jgi:hypothetical protein
MRKIMTIGLAVFTGTVLAFGSPIAASAVESTTPNKDAFCDVESVPAMVADLTADLAAATAVHDAAEVLVVERNAAVVAATSSLSGAVLDHISALDGTNASTQSIALNTFNVRSADFGTAVSSWLDAHIAEVNANNSVLGTSFLLAYTTQVSGAVCSVI